MDAYVYQADFYCDVCTEEIKDELCKARHQRHDDDSEDYPQGPYPDGGGESDVPQCCGNCGEFLENPLTEEGYTYLYDMIISHLSSGRGDRKILLSWVDFYGVDLSDLFDSIAARKIIDEHSKR